MAKATQAKIQRSTTKIVLGFVVLVMLMVLFVVYFSFSKTIITIALKPQPLSASESFAVSDAEPAPAASEDASPSLKGTLLRVQRAKEKSFYGEIASTETLEAKAHGVVTIMNKYSAAQPLVVGTRLLSNEGVLFRTKETIRVAAGASVEVEAEADQPGLAGEIGPSRFTIVALWPGLQEKIYGESKGKMIDGTIVKRIITNETIQQAKEQLLAEAYQEALNQLAHELEVNYPNAQWISEATKREVLKEEASVEPGTEANAFVVQVDIAATTLLFDLPDVRKKMNAVLIKELPEHLELSDLDQTQLAYEMTDLDHTKKTATLKVMATGKGIPKLSAPMFQREPITNMDKQSIRAYFLEFDEVEDVEVKFQPFWVVRSPTLIDHIEIQLK